LAGCHFDAIYTAQDIGSYKPDLKNFHYLLEHVKSDFGVEKEGLVHVAQSLFHDHRPAKKVGIQSVWVDREGMIGEKAHGAGGEEEYGYRLRVESLGELARIVEEAYAKA
jgi:FMN phosphatase YigB (HAD superfamily)